MTEGVTGHADGWGMTQTLRKTRTKTAQAAKGDRFIPPDVDTELTPKTRAFVHQLFDRIEALERRIEKLEALLGNKRTPQNSSLPPSSVHPHSKPPNKKPKSTRKQGGQPGHKRHTRPLIPTEQCDHIEKLLPTQCRCCHQPLVGTDPEPWRHQVSELPAIKAYTVEYQLGRLNCPRCAITTRAKLPHGVPKGMFGPRLMALSSLLMAHFRQSKRKTAEFLSDLLNIPCSSAMTVKMQNFVSQALATPHQDLRASLNTEFNVHMDETPTKEKNGKAWMWVATTTQTAVYAIFASRAATAITHLLGEGFQGVVNCDRAKMYFMVKHLQWCWSHLIRDIQAMIDSGVSDRVFLGRKLEEQTKAVFRNWHRFKSGELTWEQFQAQTLPIAKRFNELLYQGGGSHDRKLRNQCLSLYDHHENLWRFLCNPGIEPTNNAAERALRGAVIYRKLSFGTQSESGSRFVERIFSIIETCRLRNRNSYAYLVEAITAKISNKPAPNLLDP
jgi:transposase